MKSVTQSHAVRQERLPVFTGSLFDCIAHFEFYSSPASLELSSWLHDAKCLATFELRGRKGGGHFFALRFVFIKIQEGLYAGIIQIVLGNINRRNATSLQFLQCCFINIKGINMAEVRLFVEFLYQLTHFGDVEEVIDFQLIVGLDASIDVLAFQVVDATTMRGVDIAEAIG